MELFREYILQRVAAAGFRVEMVSCIPRAMVKIIPMVTVNRNPISRVNGIPMA